MEIVISVKIKPRPIERTIEPLPTMEEIGYMMEALKNRIYDEYDVEDVTYEYTVRNDD